MAGTKEISVALSSRLSEVFSGQDPYFLSQALLALDADLGVLKSGGTAASYLDAIPTWENQATGTSYLRLPGIANNFVSFDTVTLAMSGSWELELTTTLYDVGDSHSLLCNNTNALMQIEYRRSDDTWQIYFGGSSNGTNAWRDLSAPITYGTEFTIKLTWDGVDEAELFINGVSKGTKTISSPSDFPIHYLGQRAGGDPQPSLSNTNRLTVDSGATLDIDFAGAPKGATSFTATSGQTVTINSTAINTPAAIQRASGSDARQVSATLQGKLLTTSANNLPVGHLPGVSSNYFSVPDAANLDTFTNFTLEAKGVTLPDWTPSAPPGLMGKYRTSPAQRSWRWHVQSDGKLALVLSHDGTVNTTYVSTVAVSNHYISDGDTADLMVMRNGVDIRFYVNGVKLGDDVTVVTTALHNSTEPLSIGMGYNTTGYPMLGSMTRARVWNSAVAVPANPTETPVLDVNFEVDATHGDSSFTATSGQTVTVHTSGDNPAAVIGYPVIRTDGSDDFMAGTFAENLTAGRMFLVLTAIGGEAGGRSFATSGATGNDLSAPGAAWSYQSSGSLRSYNSTVGILHHGSGWAGRYLHEVRFSGTDNFSKRNNTDEQTDTTDSNTLSSIIYNIASSSPPNLTNAALDIEFLGLYPASMTDVDAASLVATLNARFEIF